MNSYNFFTTSTNGKFSHYGPLNIDSNLRPHHMVRHSIQCEIVLNALQLLIGTLHIINIDIKTT